MARDTWARNAFAKSIENDENNINEQNTSDKVVHIMFTYVTASNSQSAERIECNLTYEELSKSLDSGDIIIPTLRRTQSGVTPFMNYSYGRISSFGRTLSSPNDIHIRAFYPSNVGLSETQFTIVMHSDGTITT